MTVDVSKPEPIHEILLVALTAARYGAPPESSLAQAIVSGDRTLTLEQLDFDSLAWMEFCISVEEQSGLLLSPVDVVDMRYFFEIEDWLRARA